jgi:hypothetical protein
LIPTIDPRLGDIEHDASSSKRRSLLSLAGSLLAEISLPKLAVAWMLLIVVPCLMLGIAPVVASIWFNKLSYKITSPSAGAWPAILLVALIALGWFGGRRLFRLAERSFWSLNSLAVQPVYAACREALRHLAEALLSTKATKTQRSALRAVTSVVSGAVICGIALLVLMLALPSAHLFSDIAIASSPKRLAIVALANSVVLVAPMSRLPRWFGQLPMRPWTSPAISKRSPRALTKAARDASRICRISTSSANATVSELRAADRARVATSG